MRISALGAAQPDTVEGFPSAAAKSSVSGGQIRLMRALRPVLLPHQPVDQPERQNSKGKREDRERFEAGEVDDDEFPRHGKQRYENHGLQLYNAFLAVQDAHYRVVEFQCDQHGHDHAEYGLETGGVHGHERIQQIVSHLHQNQMRGSDDNNAADQQGQDQCHRLLKALVNSEAGPGFRCLLKQAKAKSATFFAFRVDLSAHGSLNPIVTFELGLWVQLKKSGGGAGRYLFGSSRSSSPVISACKVAMCSSISCTERSSTLCPIS